jgi:hypothetical protein
MATRTRRSHHVEKGQVTPVTTDYAKAVRDAQHCWCGHLSTSHHPECRMCHPGRCEMFVLCSEHPEPTAWRLRDAIEADHG